MQLRFADNNLLKADRQRMEQKVFKWKPGYWTFWLMWFMPGSCLKENTLMLVKLLLFFFFFFFLLLFFLGEGGGSPHISSIITLELGTADVLNLFLFQESLMFKTLWNWRKRESYQLILTKKTQSQNWNLSRSLQYAVGVFVCASEGKIFKQNKQASKQTNKQTKKHGEIRVNTWRNFC